MTMYSVSEEAFVLLITVYGGLLMGLAYNFYRVFRGFLRPSKLATNIQDILFWSLISVLAFFVLIMSNQGQLRFYNFLGFMLGILLYELLLTRFVTKVLLFFCKWIQILVKDLWKLVQYPFLVGFCLISGPYSYCKSKALPVYYRKRQEAKHRLVKEMNRWRRGKKST